MMSMKSVADRIKERLEEFTRRLLLQRLEKKMPSAKELQKLAKRFPPPQSWFEEDFSDLID
jgi:hypothetical protein